MTTNAAGDITSLLGKTLAYDSAGRLSEATAVPPCPSGTNCAGLQTTLSRFNGWGQRFLRDTPATQSVFSYGTDGHNLLSENTRNLSTSSLSTTEHIWLPTASGPMPIATVINGVHHAVHADHLNTPRRLSDSAGQTRWQWPYSGFGGVAPQATPAAGQAAVSYSLRYPGQIDDGNGLFYNWHRFYDPRVGRYTSSDPIGLEGGWNRFGYVGGNPLGASDPEGLLPGEIPQHESEIPFEPPQCKDDDCLCKCLEQYLGGETYVGTGIAVSGLPTVPKRFATPGSSPGISVASQMAGESLGKRRLLRRVWAPTFANPGAMTTSAARVVGRWVPGAGWAILGFDGYQVHQCKTKCEDEQCKK